MSKNRDRDKSKEKYQRMRLKNGWDLPGGEKPPSYGRKQKLARAYELLVLKTDEEYIREAKERPEKSASDIKTEPAIDVTAETGAGYKKSSSYTREILDALSEKEWRSKRKRNRLLALFSALAVVLVFAGWFFFGPPVLTADISSYETTPIQVEGITKKAFLITPGELAGMKKVSIKVEVVQGELTDDEEPESGRAIGPTLETFLKKYGKTTDDFRSVRVYSDNEDSKALVQTMKEKTVVLSIADGRHMLKEKEMPLRLAIEGERTDEWFGNVRKIVFVK